MGYEWAIGVCTDSVYAPLMYKVTKLEMIQRVLLKHGFDVPQHIMEELQRFLVDQEKTCAAWREYAVGALADPETNVQAAANVADKMLLEQVKRFG